MKLVEGILDYTNTEPGQVYAFTANSIVTRNGLVMGGGAALAAREAYTNVEIALGDEIQKKLFNEVFGTVIVPYGDFFVCAFQTKSHFSLPSYLELIEAACHSLVLDLQQMFGDNQPTVHLNFPGIGLGGLTPELVLPVIEPLLPDNVVVYK